jgi:Na+/melibiose symporter-like transporter
MLSDTFQTLVIVPLYALTPEITLDYDERTSLTGYRMFFNLFASLVTAVAAPAIVDSVLASGATQQRGYLIVGSLFGALAAIPLLLIFFAGRHLCLDRACLPNALFPDVIEWDELRTRRRQEGIY